MNGEIAIEKVKETFEPERAVIAGLSADTLDIKERSSDESLDELEALLCTAGGVCVGRVLQNRHTPEPRTFIGDGKVQEIRALIDAEGCTLAVFDNELSPSQMRALSEDLGVRVIDRAALILDIFAQRASTREGRLQVELAQYKYILPRLTGMWTHLVGQTGTSAPIGTRGPGETQLETDRRHIRRKIDKLEAEIDEVQRVRATQRRKREKNSVPVVALVGYTNSGKSTLLNRLTDAGITAENRLFDTLDTTTRRMKLNDVTEVLLSDTVGFIRKLPHHLIDAFRATLEELTYADVLIHVIDASNPLWAQQAQVVDELIEQLGASQTPRIEAFNKCDIYTTDIIPHGENIVAISAKTGAGMGELLKMIENVLGLGQKRVTLLIPYDKGALLDLIHDKASVIGVEYREGGTELDAVLTPELYGRLREYVIQAGEKTDKETE